MFDEFRQSVKALAKSNKMTYAKIAECSGIRCSTIKSFMCGATNSRRVAEKISDVFEAGLLYKNGSYSLFNNQEENQ